MSPYAAALREPGKSKRAWDADFLKRLQPAASGDAIRFELTGGVMASGRIKITQFRDGELTYLSGELTEPETGKFFFLTPPPGGKSGKAAGVIEFWGSKKAYRIEPTGANNDPELWERRLDEVLCLTLPLMDAAAAATNDTAEIPPLRPDAMPDYVPSYNSNIVSLQSYPGSPAVLLLDYFGGYTPTWGGVSYPKPSVSNAQIRDVWKRIAEDFMPFNINVTTDLKVYQNAPVNSRQKCVFTPSTSAMPAGAAGVAYIGSWDWGSDTVCWSIYTTGKSAGEVGSHEPGHTLGLGHQGTSTQGYYGGQGSAPTGWGPLMGVGYYQPVSSWAKGEYLDANNHEDELNIITNQNVNVTYRPDDTGATLATARYLEVYSDFTASAEGVIERTSDTDAFQFTTTGGSVSLTANPVGDWASLAVMATLANASDTIIASNNPQNVLSASITMSLSAGTYTFRVTGAGRNSPLTNGFSAYSSLGYYSITGSVAGARLPTRLSVAEHSPSGTLVGTVPPNNNTNNSPLAFTIVSGNTGSTFSIDSAGVLRVANNTLLDYRRLATNTMLAVQFELLVNITNQNNAALTELNRRVVVAVLNVNDQPVVTGFTVSVLQHSQRGAILGTVTVTDPDFYQALTYSIASGDTNGVFAIDSGGALTVAGDLSAAQQSVYNLTIAANDNAALTALVGTGYVTINVVTNSTPFQPGTISYALYDGIGSGTLVSDLTSNARFPKDPTSEKQMPTFEGDSNRADSYGAVMRGYLIAPVSGSYTFWIATDDNGELWMSTTTNPASMTRIAYISGSSSYASPRQWTKYSTQQSAARTLVAGQGYYLEARMKEGGGGDNFAVAWKGPATANLTNVISGLCLAPYFINYTPHATGFAKSLYQDAFAGAAVGRIAVTDVNSNDGHSFAITSGNGAGLFTLDQDGFVRVADEAALLASTPATYTLQVTTTDTGSPPLSGTATATINVVATNAITATSPRREIWNNIGSGTAVSDLTNNAAYPRRPDKLEVLSSFASAQGIGDNYGSRIRAFLTPTNDGVYRFFIASDDSGSLLLSTDGNPSNAVRIAYVSGSTSVSVWNTYASQTSATRNLLAGQPYYIEVLQKEGGGADHVEVAWAGPGIVDTNGLPSTNIIAGSFLSPVDLNYAPLISNQSMPMFNVAPNNTFIGKVAVLDSALDALSFKIIAGNTNDMFAIAPDTGGITLVDNSLIATGMTSFALTVAVQDSGYGGLFPLRSAQATVTVNVVGTNSPFVWTGAAGTNGWSDPDNWAGVVPGTNNRVIFGYPSMQVNVNDTVAKIASVQLTNAGFNISGSPLIVQSGITNSGDNTWALNTTLGAAQTWQNSSGTFTVGGAVTNSGFALGIVANSDFRVSGPITGAGGLNKSGTARLLIQGTHPYTGPTVVSAASGTTSALEVNGANDLDLSGSDLTMNGRMDLWNHNATVGALSGSGVIFANDTAHSITVGANNHSGSFSGILTNSSYATGVTLGLLKAGTGFQTLSGVNGYSGSTVIRAGQLTLGNASALGAGPAMLGDAGTGSNAVSLLASSAVIYNNNLIVAAAGTGTVTIGTTNISPGAVNTQFGGSLTLNRDVTLQAGSTDRTTFAGRITGPGNVTILSPYAVGRRVVFDRPSGVANDFLGDITLGTSAYLQIGNSDSLGNRGVPEASVVNFNLGSQLRFSPASTGDSETLGALNSLASGAGIVDVVTGAGTFTLVLGAGDKSALFSGNLVNSSGSLALTKIGNGTQTLAGGGSFTGAVTVNGGVLVAASSGAFGSAPGGVLVNAGASLALSNNIFIASEPLTLNGSGYAGTGALHNDGGNNTHNGSITLTSPSAITAATGALTLGGALNTAGSTVTFHVTSGAAIQVSGAISGAGGLIKTGSDPLTLNASNTYTGPTMIAAGTLALGVTGSLNGSSTVNVQAGATLDASAAAAGLIVPPTQILMAGGTLLGPVLVNGTLSPGASIGVLTFSNDLSLAGTTLLEIKKNGATCTNDFMSVAGTLTLGGTLIVTNTGQALAPGDTFTLFSAAAIAGSFADLVLPPLANGFFWDTTRLAVDGTLRVGTVAPPQMAASLLGGTNLAIQVQSQAGVNYVLEATPGQDVPWVWTSVSTNLGTGDLLSIPVVVDSTETNQFFRLKAY